MWEKIPHGEIYLRLKLIENLLLANTAKLTAKTNCKVK